MLFVIAVLLVIDLLAFKAVYTVISGKKPVVRMLVAAIYWLISLLLFISVTSKRNGGIHDIASLHKVSALAGVFILLYIPKLVIIIFHMADDIIHFTSWTVTRLNGRMEKKKPDPTAPRVNKRYTRRAFVTKTGMALAALPFFSILDGTANGRFRFRVERAKPGFGNRLPSTFKGFKIVQISDLHISSFYKNEDMLEKAIEIINALEPDIIVHTGDFVSIFASEVKHFVPILKKLKAKYGCYSILGNHDYGDYHQWNSIEEKKENLEKLIAYQEEAGFKVLLNESVILEQGDSKIALTGVENWGKPPFAQYGDLNKALSSVSEDAFTILLSHDPSHWDAEVLGKKNIPLTLAGHTHGMQFGVEWKNIKWSPVKMKYPRWGGLYKEGGQFLYVNRGLGSIGVPIRVGMPPEITLIELA